LGDIAPVAPLGCAHGRKRSLIAGYTPVRAFVKFMCTPIW